MTNGIRLNLQENLYTHPSFLCTTPHPTYLGSYPVCRMGWWVDWCGSRIAYVFTGI